MFRRDFAALLAMIEAHESVPFGRARGRDCVSYAAAAVTAQTGVDPLAQFPVWRSARAANALIASEGGLLAAIDRRFARVEPALAGRGDIAGVDDPNFGIALMIVEGATLVGPGARGNARLPRDRMIVAWCADAMRQVAPAAGASDHV